MGILAYQKYLEPYSSQRQKQKRLRKYILEIHC